jgi:glucokinase
VIETVGVDVGGTKVSIATLSDGELGAIDTDPTELHDAETLIDAIADGVERVRSDATAAVGVGVPSVIDFATGTARSSVNVPLEDVPLREILSDRIGLPVFVDNDATVAALAEAWDGERIAASSLVMFTVGTGVGGGVVIGGQLYRGATGAAAELGHTLIAAELAGGAPATTRFPQPGALESWASGRALDALAADAARRDPDSALGRLAAEGREVDGRDAVEAARAGDEVAVGLIRLIGERLGIAVANAINTFDPDVVAIGGGVCAAGELLVDPVAQTARRFVLSGVGTETEIRLAQHGADAGVLGAALLALTECDR